MEKERIYLDNAATTALHPEVLEVMLQTMRDCYGNPSSTHAHGRTARALIENARGSIAKMLNCSPSEIFFTSGGTEADNFALRSAVQAFGIKTIVTSPTEHHAILHTVEDLEKKGLVQVHYLQVDDRGNISMEELATVLASHPNALVTLMHANNEIGTMIDIYAVGELAHAHGALFHSDTVQTMAHFKFDLGLGHIDFLAGSAHKFNGPKGSGFIYISKKRRTSPMITGGAQEREMRGGTENIYGIVGLAKAFELSFQNLETDMAQIHGLKELMREKLRSELPDIQFNGNEGERSLYTVLSVSFPVSEMGEMLLFNLDIDGISASGGSACTSGSNTGSHVLRAICPGSKRTTVRFSFGKFNTEEDVVHTVDKLKKWYGMPVISNG